MTPPSPPPRPSATTWFDTTALTRPVATTEVREFRRAARASGDPRWQRGGNLPAVVAIFSGAGLVFVVVGFVMSTVLGGTRSGMLPVPFLVPVVAVVAVVAVAIVRARRGGGRWTRYLRLEQFAATNRLQFSPRSSPPNYQGAIFGVGDSRAVVEHIWTSDGPLADCGTYRYTTGSGKNRSTHTWQFAALRLEGALPHLLLDAKANNTFLGTNLPTGFDRDQRVSLGGEFDQHFDLYAPQGYGHDTFYVFTPDLMAHLIDQTRAFDVEFVDDWMFLYTRGDLQVTDPATWQRLAAISDTVNARMRDRSRTYRDQRVADQQGPAALLAGVPPVQGPPTIAPQGRRLRRKRVWLPMLLIGLGWLLIQFLRYLL